MSSRIRRKCGLTYYAHSYESFDRAEWHRLSVHLTDTAARAAATLESIGGVEAGRAVGLLHDIGKYTLAFQRRLEGKGRVDHSTAGAKLAVQRYGPVVGKMLAFCIAGHHAGLADGIALNERLETAVPDPDPVWKDEIVLPPPQELAAPTRKPRNLKSRSRGLAGFCTSFFIRMLFSALVDADYLDTEAYYDSVEGQTRLRGRHPALPELSRRLDTHLEALTKHATTSAVNRLRQDVLTHVRKQAEERPGVFTLTVPTGGGKTLTSLAFALDHAFRHGLTRVIYVIPYVNIIEQTAAVFRRALQHDDEGAADFVVEHHSTFDEGRIENRESQDKLRLAMENWDAPIIVTTAVQFFESLFANRPSRCRKLHHIANSVIILDEAQTLPPGRLRPCVVALDELARNWRTSVVLCTATQPALRANDDKFMDGLEGVRELAPEPKRLYQELKRTRIRHEGTMDDMHLAGRLRAAPQVLCIVNTRRHARELYESLDAVEGATHLTTLMCARHRRERLAVVRERLATAKPVRLIATSLVEAGVDLDFPVVWRAEAGMDSITQAAGRCNREGRSTVADVFVFEPAQAEGRKPPPELAQAADAAREVLRQHSGDPTSLEALTAYFQKLYWVKGVEQLDTADILHRLSERGSSLDFPFESIAHDFRMIETTMVPVIVPYRGATDDDDAETLLARLQTGHIRPGRAARSLQPYVVQVPPPARAGLLAAGAAEVIDESRFGLQFVVVRNLDLYQDDVGLTWDDPTFRMIENLMV